MQYDRELGEPVVSSKTGRYRQEVRAVSVAFMKTQRDVPRSISRSIHGRFVPRRLAGAEEMFIILAVMKRLVQHVVSVFLLHRAGVCVCVCDAFMFTCHVSCLLLFVCVLFLKERKLLVM